jgi:hypothetical protein
MPMTVYVDGSGMHDGSDVLTLSAFAMDSELIEPFNRDWNETADSKTTPGLQVADLFAWLLNRQERCLDQLHLAFISFMTVRHLAYRCAGAPDFKPKRCTWSSSGRLVCYYREMGYMK